jgi:hypothetical protein
LPLLLADEHLYREAGYIALSRGRCAKRLYAVASEPDVEARVEQQGDAG